MDAERMLFLRLLETDFYTQGDEALDPELRTDASKDWILATSIITESLLLRDDPETRAAIGGPYQSERLGDYSYTMRTRDALTQIWKDPRLRPILAKYHPDRQTPGQSALVGAKPSIVRGETAEIPGYFV